MPGVIVKIHFVSIIRRKKKAWMELLNLYRVLAAAHLTYAVDPIPEAFSQRGGLMLVAPPEQMKTTMVACLRGYGDCLVISDLNVKQMVKYLRDEIAAGRYHTLALTAFEKIYKRDSDTASNIEATLCAMIEEGFGHAAFEDSRSFVRIAKCLVVGALVESYYRKQFPSWLDSGFARRFLWCHFALRDRYAVVRSVVKWEPLQMSANGNCLPRLPYGPIPFNLTETERKKLFRLISTQPGQSTPQILMSKILCVLKWHFRDDLKGDQTAMDVMEDFGESLNIKAGGACVDV